VAFRALDLLAVEDEGLEVVLALAAGVFVQGHGDPSFRRGFKKGSGKVILEFQTPF
jgi:hypothetical protein